MNRRHDSWLKSKPGRFVCLALGLGLLLALSAIVWRMFAEKDFYKQELEELGFDCETTTFKRVAATMERLQDERAFVDVIATSGIAQEELLECNDTEVNYNFWVAASDDLEILLGLAAEHYICRPPRANRPEEVAANLRFHRQGFKGNFLAIGQYVYGFQETYQRTAFAAFLDVEEINHEAYSLSALSCKN